MHSLKIIIADVNPAFRAGIELTIKKADSTYTVFHADSGYDVLELTSTNDIDVILIDVMIPELNCIQTTSIVRKGYPHIKIIGLSLNNDKYNMVKMFNAGINGYILKSTSLERIETAFKTIAKGGNYFTEEIRCFLSGKVCDEFKHYNNKSFHEALTPKEKEILMLICQQLSTKEISRKTDLSEKTIEIHRGHIMEKTRSKNMIGLALYAVQKGWINMRSIDN
jgi:DNA-binding NarL/FixJ family response regulator